jgi:hypothetical protein
MVGLEESLVARDWGCVAGLWGDSGLSGLRPGCACGLAESQLMGQPKKLINGRMLKNSIRSEYV